MTAPRTGLLPSAPDPGTPPIGTVMAVTGSVPVAVTVTAVVVTRGRSPFLPATLAAVRAQAHAPDDVVVVDVDTSPATSAHADLTLDGARYVAASGARTFGEGVDAALRAAGVPERGWLWLLHDDSAPAPGALAALLRATEHTSSVAVAGSKQRRWEVSAAGGPLDPAAADRGVLVEVGHTVSPLGRRMTGFDDTEIDQGQHDAREDVLAVGLAGALVRASVWRDLGGTDPSLGHYGDSTDFCRRVRLAGHRVVVAPQAVVRHAQASLLGLREPRGDGGTYGARRRSVLHARLVSVPAWLLPLAALGMLLWAPVLAAYRLALKRPAEARDELVAPLRAVSRVRAVVRARRAVARTSVVPRGVLRPLTGSWREVWSERRDRRLARAEQLRTRVAPSELEQAEQRRVAARRRGVLALVLVAGAAPAVVAFGPVAGLLASGGRLAGGSLLAPVGTPGDVWQAATSGWVRDGLGGAAPADPVLVPLAGLTVLTGSLGAAVTVALTLALPLAALGGWAAAGAVTRSPWLRAWAAVLWAASPALLDGLHTGRLGAVVAHLALPWAALAVARALGAHATDRPPGAAGPVPSLGAVGAAGLLLAVTVAAAPVLLPVAVAVLAAAALVLLVRGRRRPAGHALLTLLPSLVVGAPFWWAVARSAAPLRLLLAEPAGAPGTVRVPDDLGPAGLSLLLGRPADPGTWFVAPDLGADGLAEAAGTVLRAVAVGGPYVAGAVVLVLAVVALFRRHAATARAGWFLGAAGLATALVAQGALGGTAGWAGPGLSLLLLGLGAAALCGAPARRAAVPREPGDTVVVPARAAAERPEAAVAAVPAADPDAGTPDAAEPDAADPAPGPADQPEPGRRRRAAGRAARLAGVAALGTVAALAPVAETVSWLTTGDGVVTTAGPADVLHATAGPVVPAVGQQMQAPPRQARVLQLGVADDGAVTYAPLRGDGSLLLDASAVAATRDGASGERLDTLAAELAAGTAPSLADRLAELGFGAVQVRSDSAPATADLLATLDLVPGLSRVTEGQDVALWRVAPAVGPAPGWARIESPAVVGHEPPTTAVLPSSGARVETRVASGDAGRVLVLAESAGPGWRATLDGTALRPVQADGLQAFALGADGGRLVVAHESAHRVPWLVVGGFVVVVYVLLALPVGRSVARRRTR